VSLLHLRLAAGDRRLRRRPRSIPPGTAARSRCWRSPTCSWVGGCGCVVGVNGAGVRADYFGGCGGNRGCC